MLPEPNTTRPGLALYSNGSMFDGQDPTAEILKDSKGSPNLQLTIPTAAQYRQYISRNEYDGIFCNLTLKNSPAPMLLRRLLLTRTGPAPVREWLISLL